MRCPHCHADIPDGASPCPRCGKPADDSRGRVLEPELVDANHHPLRPGRSEGGNAYDSSGGFTRIFYTTFPGGQGLGRMLVAGGLAVGHPELSRARDKLLLSSRLGGIVRRHEPPSRFYA